jgi:hypothetical protein
MFSNVLEQTTLMWEELVQIYTIHVHIFGQKNMGQIVMLNWGIY